MKPSRVPSSLTVITIVGVFALVSGARTASALPPVFAGINSGLTARNAVPTAGISGPSALFVGEKGSWTLSASDPSAADRAGTFKYEIDWNGDGSVDQAVNAGHSTSVSHTYSSTGSKTIAITATDRNGRKSAEVDKAVTVQLGPAEFIPKPNGKIASAKLSMKSFTATQAGTVKLTCKFSPKSTVLRYVLSVKKGKKWTVMKRVSKTGFYKAKYTLSVKELFAGRPVERGAYRLKLSAELSADKNSKTLGFKVT